MGHHPKAAADRCGLHRQAEPRHLHITHGRAGERCKHAQEGRLAGTVRTKQGYKFTFLYFKIQPAQDGLNPKRLTSFLTDIIRMFLKFYLPSGFLLETLIIHGRD